MRNRWRPSRGTYRLIQQLQTCRRDSAPTTPSGRRSQAKDLPDVSERGPARARQHGDFNSTTLRQPCPLENGPPFETMKRLMGGFKPDR